MKQKLTISDVAKEVGASISTVSVALSGRPGVSDKRRAEIQRAAFEMGYRPDRQAALIRLERTHLLGVVFYMEQEFQISLMDPLFRYAEKQGYRLVAAGCVGQRSEMDCIESLMQDRCEGIVLIGTKLSAEYLEKIAAVIPLITLCQEVGSTSVDAVVSDDAYGVIKSFEHLWQQGFRDIVHIRGTIKPMRRCGKLPFNNAWKTGASRQMRILRCGSIKAGKIPAMGRGLPIRYYDRSAPANGRCRAQ